MRLVFLYGPVASGKLTVAKALAARTGFALFHNHLVVDAVAALFPFGSEPFVRLRERMWLELIGEAAGADRSLVFTFAPEPSVEPGFPQRVQALVEAAGGEVVFVALSLPYEEQRRRVSAADRVAFGKLTSPDLLDRLRADCEACLAAMPEPTLRIDTSTTPPADAAGLILARLDAAS